VPKRFDKLASEPGSTFNYVQNSEDVHTTVTCNQAHFGIITLIFAKL